MQDTNVWIAYICDADLRRLDGFIAFASEMTLWDAAELYVNHELRRVAQPGDPSEKNNP